MKKHFLVILSIVTIGFMSCSKNDHSTPGGSDPNNQNSRIKTWIGNSAYTYVYDGSGRCIEISKSTGGKTTFEYSPGKILQKQFNNQGVNDFSHDYTLDSEGYVISETRPTVPDFSGTVVYNANKQAIKKIYNFGNQTQVIDYFYSNGNCDSSRHSTDGNWHTTVLRTFYTDKLNSIDNRAEGTPFYGLESKNLLKTEQYVYSDGSSSTLTSYTYEFDANGRVVKENATQGGNLKISYITYY